MSAFITSFRYGVASLVFGVSCGLAFVAAAEDVVEKLGKPSKDEIVRALAPSSAPTRMRGLSLRKSGGSPAQVIQQATKKALDMDVPFEFNSDRLTDEGREVLKKLGDALNSDKLASVKTVVLEGHTDASGSAAYNKHLSQRRAESVRTFLVEQMSVATKKLRTAGKGSTELADPNNPNGGVNRRVRVVVSY